MLADGDKTEPEKRLQAAQQLTDIRESSSQPFRLSATVQLFEESGHAQKGTYELAWENPTQWKDELKLPDFSQSRLISGERLFLSRKPRPLSIELSRLLLLAASGVSNLSSPTSGRDCLRTAQARGPRN